MPPFIHECFPLPMTPFPISSSHLPASGARHLFPRFLFHFFILDTVVHIIVNGRIQCISLYLHSTLIYQVISSNYHRYDDIFFALTIASLFCGKLPTMYWSLLASSLLTMNFTIFLFSYIPLFRFNIYPSSSNSFHSV